MKRNKILIKHQKKNKKASMTDQFKIVKESGWEKLQKGQFQASWDMKNVIDAAVYQSRLV